MPSPSDLFTLAPEERRRLEAALEPLQTESGWEIAHLALQSLRCEGDTSACRLELQVTVYLLDTAGSWLSELELHLESSRWRPTRYMPFLQEPTSDPTSTSAVTDGDGLALRFTLGRVRAQPPQGRGSAAWLHYVERPAASSRALVPRGSMCEQLETVIALWLRDELSVTTVVGAEEALLGGPVGHFGLVESLVMERTGQADLAVEATLLAEADDSEEMVGDPTLFLSLLGERFGLWLLYRRQAKVLKATRKDAPPQKEWICSVQVAETVEALMAQCGLIPVEKRLFQQAGCLPHATLWPEVEHPGSDSLPRDTEPLEPGSKHTTLDLSGVPDRQRQHMQAILQLVLQGKLDSHDTDLLLKTARHLGRGRNNVKSTTSAATPAAKRR